jgi:hypothetical protein
MSWKRLRKRWWVPRSSRPAFQLAAADAEVQRPFGVGPAVGHPEPALPEVGVGERLERLLRTLPETPFDGEVVLADGHFL